MMKTIQQKSLVILLVLMTVAFTPSCYTQQPSIISGHEESTTNETPSATLEVEILSYINQYRQSKGLSALTTNAVITGQATKHSSNMALKKVAFSHDGFETRVKNISAQLGAIRASAENVAYGKIGAKEVVDLWLKSPGHKKNIEGNFRFTGIGLATAKDGTIFFTEIFTF